MKFNWICAVLLAASLAMSGCGGGSKSSSGSSGGAPIPVVSPTGTASTPPVSEAAFVCPTSDSASSSVRVSSASRAQARQTVRRPASVVAKVTPAMQTIAVSYERSVATSSRASLAASEIRVGASLRREFDFPHIGLTTRILAVPSASLAHAEAMLRAEPGVRSVSLTGARRYPLAVTAPYYTNDPYFTGFANPSGGNGSTFEVPLYSESANVPGQWNFHASQFEHAFAYSQPNNGSNVTNPGALGSAGIKLAIIDSGADTTQPDLGPKIAYQRCIITDPTGNQSTSNFVTDPDGHGTNVSGLAGATTGNGFGFTAAGGASTLYEYRVDPTPDTACADATTSANDPQCGADPNDIVSAINDAVAHGVNVISMSLGAYASDGSSGCSGGNDLDTAEGNAVMNAVAAKVVVVAAAGNGGNTSQPGLTAPACDPNVIAVGASALDDGSPNASGHSGGSVAAPVEYVAAYSSYGSPGADYHNAAAWGIVAPGGDPQDSSDADNLHWINDLWTSTPYDPTDAGSCGEDYPGNVTTPASCSVLIAGTSMATPTIAGAAALILAVNNGSYRTSAQIKQLFCATADDLSADPHEGCGRLNVYRAMAVALGDTTPP